MTRVFSPTGHGIPLLAIAMVSFASWSIAAKHDPRVTAPPPIAALRDAPEGRKLRNLLCSTCGTNLSLELALSMGLRRLGTKSSQTRRWRGESRANQSLKWVFRGLGNYRPIPRRLWMMSEV